MRVRELVAALAELDADDAHVEVLGHDGSWAWVSEVTKFNLVDPEGLTTTCIIHVSNDGVRMNWQPIGKPASQQPMSHRPPED